MAKKREINPYIEGAKLHTIQYYVCDRCGASYQTDEIDSLTEHIQLHSDIETQTHGFIVGAIFRNDLRKGSRLPHLILDVYPSDTGSVMLKIVALDKVGRPKDTIRKNRDLYLNKVSFEKLDIQISVVDPDDSYQSSFILYKQEVRHWKRTGYKITIDGITYTEVMVQARGYTWILEDQFLKAIGSPSDGRGNRVLETSTWDGQLVYKIRSSTGIYYSTSPG